MSKRITNAFDHIVAEESLKQSTAAFVLKKTSEKPRFTVFNKVAVSFACLLVLIVGAFSFAYFNVSSSISIDVNPSVEFGVNIFDRVVRVAAYNDDAKSVLEGLPLNNLKYDEAIELLMASEGFEKYLTEDAYVSVCVAASSQQKDEEIIKCIGSVQSSTELHCYGADSQIIEEAHCAGLSFGKYRAYLELKEVSPDITVEEIKGLSMKKIQDMITNAAASDGNSDSHSENGAGSGGSGSGQGNGNGQGGQGNGNGQGNN